MSKSFAAGLLSMLASFTHDTFRVLVTLNTAGTRLTNHPTDLSFGGSTYTSAHVEVKGLSENLRAEAPAAELLLGDLDSTRRETFFLDGYRGETATIRLLYRSSGVWTDTGFTTTWALDADALDGAEAVVIRLGSSDAVQGTEVARRTTQEAGCQWDFATGDCPFRWRKGMSEALKTCDKGYDTPNGCKAHFPDVTQSGVTYRTPRPFGGFRGGLSARLVLR